MEICGLEEAFFERDNTQWSLRAMQVSQHLTKCPMLIEMKRSLLRVLPRMDHVRRMATILVRPTRLAVEAGVMDRKIMVASVRGMSVAQIGSK